MTLAARLSGRLAQLRLALMMLTRLPMGRFSGTAPTLAQSRWAFPLAGVPVGLIGWGVFSGAACLGLAPLTVGIVAVAAMALVTGALHYDGLSDFADGLGGRDPARRLEIMRDSRIGSYGAVVLIFVTLAQLSSIAALPEGKAPWLFLLMAVASRMLMLCALDLMPAARADGLGKAASGGTLPWTPGLIAVVLIAVPLGWPAVGLLTGMAVTALAISLMARRRLGGQTGDVLGAVQLSSETAGWVLVAALF
ncbi:MAG: adenosylcobinamide-GDP ribazoletransferase [Paracoccaceae bacterium]